MKRYVAIEETFGMVLDYVPPKNLIFQTNQYASNYWNMIDYVPTFSKDFIDIYPMEYKNLKLEFYESKSGSLVEFWKTQPHIFQHWNLERFIKCNNRLAI